MTRLNPIGIITFERKKAVEEAVRGVVTDPRFKGAAFCVNRDIMSFPRMPVRNMAEGEFLRKIRVLVSFGGDGTFLSAARLAARLPIPLIGVNMGGLGFLTDVPAIGAKDELFRILNGEYLLEKRMMFDITLRRAGRPIVSDLCLNDVVIKGSKLFSSSVFQGPELVSGYNADGIIFSTPTGSTAYNMAAGGPIVHPLLDCVIITPICSHSLTQKPIVSSIGRPITLRIRDRKARMTLSIDGKKNVPVRENDEVVVARSRMVTTILKPKHAEIFENLREKLNWGRP